jgi:hypothetical protein
MRKVLLAIALIAAPLFVSPLPANAHWDHWHMTTCQPAGENSWYMTPSIQGGSRVDYWRASTGTLSVLWPMVDRYAYWGWECGYPGLPITNYWQQRVCEVGYCGDGFIQAFQGGQFAWHRYGPSAYQPQFHPW